MFKIISFCCRETTSDMLWTSASARACWSNVPTSAVLKPSKERITAPFCRPHFARTESAGTSKTSTPVTPGRPSADVSRISATFRTLASSQDRGVRPRAREAATGFWSGRTGQAAPGRTPGKPRGQPSSLNLRHRRPASAASSKCRLATTPGSTVDDRLLSALNSAKGFSCVPGLPSLPVGATY